MKQRHQNHRAAALGTGELSQVLDAARDREAVSRFCSAHVCTPADVSVDGKRLDLPRVLQLMRSRGHQVSAPTKPQHQPKARQGLTAWVVHVCISGAEFDIGFYTPSL